jgi:DNA polymerase I-like protein with 3'-5' exonuclease and polymerase domains
MTNALFLGTEDDKSYVPHLKGMFNGLTTYVVLEPWAFLTLLETYCAKRGITKIVSTNTKILSSLLAREGNTRTDPSLADYQGSVFTYKQLEIVFISPLSQLFSVTYGKFLAARFISKVTDPTAWTEATDFKWILLEPSNIEAIYHEAQSAYAIAVDIETLKKPLSIRCIGYTFVFIRPDNSIHTVSAVLPVTNEWELAWMRRFNTLPAAKIFQNGKYDVNYLLRYNSAPQNWLWDTAHLFHCWYSELPKDLAFLNAFFLRKVVYWKDLAETSDLREYYRYNALDTWATANVWIQQILQMPAWARKNYLLEFPLVYPCLLAEMTGLKRDQNRLLSARKEAEAETGVELSSLQRIVGIPNFNPSSHVQVKQLLKVIGCADITSSDEKSLVKAAYRHPFNALLLDKVLNIRGLRVLKTRYLRTDDDAKQSGIHAGEGGAKEFLGRILYALNPHGTDTGRLASREHHFWTGLQIQNIPSGFEVKQTICAETGFFLGECDLEQAESRDTAYIAGDTALIAAVSGTRDFHSVNASAFFGIPYSDIYSDSDKKPKNKAIRTLAKRVNHGANYNMGALVLVETMGLANIWEAKRLLGLPYNDPIKIAQHLLDAFHRTYPKLRGKSVPYTEGTYYAWVAKEILINRRLSSRAYHHTEYNLENYKPDDYLREGDWTRYCFGKPDKNKLDLNSYVAHCPQSLNARTLNEAFMRVFYEIALPNPFDFRLHAQIHDSILFSYKEGREDLADKVRTCMEIPVTVRDISGVDRTFTVPAALKLGKTGADGSFKRAKYWSETE